jgi:hypothetical protein
MYVEWRRSEDKRFIAAARTGWPAALDEIERLRAEIAIWQERFDYGLME